jgi:O-antigen/teichoic acid export membrane protein
LKNILRLATGDFISKALNFLAFIYLARVLGVSNFGVLEFANSVLAYFLLVADGGLELWGTRETAKNQDVRTLAARVVPLRMLLAALAFVVLLGMLPLFPGYTGLRKVLVLFGLTLFPQALSLKWLFMGKERMSRVAMGLVAGQVVFAISIFALVHSPDRLVWVPVLRLAGDAVTALYFARIFSATHGSLRLPFTFQGAKAVLRPALTLGSSQAMGLLNYNFDSVLLGFMATATTVGWYNAAYKPVAVALTLPMTYFVGLFPVLSRCYATDRKEFRRLAQRSLELSSIFVVPVVVGGMLLAAPIINLLYGSAYANSARPFRVLVWSAALAILRCNYSNGLRCTGHQKLDLRCAVASAGVNVGLNFLLIPRYGMMGAAWATVLADVVWLTMSYYYFERELVSDALPPLGRPVIAGIAMAGFLWGAEPLLRIVSAPASLVVYFAVLLLTGNSTVRSWVIRPKGEAHSVAAGPNSD